MVTPKPTVTAVLSEKMPLIRFSWLMGAAWRLDVHGQGGLAGVGCGRLRGLGEAVVLFGAQLGQKFRGLGERLAKADRLFQMVDGPVVVLGENAGLGDVVVQVFVLGRQRQGLGVGVQGAGVIAALAQVDAQQIVGVDRVGIGLQDFGEEFLEFGQRSWRASISADLSR